MKKFLKAFAIILGALTFLAGVLGFVYIITDKKRSVEIDCNQ